MRVFATCLLAACCAACGHPGPGTPTSTSSASSVESARPTEVQPVNIARVQGDLPAGYEFAGLTGRTAPLALWGFGPDWVSDPPQCGALGVPAGEDARVVGWSGSGPGGIVYAAVAEARVDLDGALVDGCGNWSVTAGHTNGTVLLVAAPPIEGVATLGMSSDATTRVEGGTETHSHADTFTAYLGDYVTYVTVVTDPGTAGPRLDADFAAGLLTKTVTALRG